MFTAIATVDALGIAVSLWVIMAGVVMGEPRMWGGGVLSALFFAGVFAVLYYIVNLPVDKEKK